MRLRRFSLLLVLQCCASAPTGTCQAFCKAVACALLNGDPKQECGACSGDEACRPGALGFLPSPSNCDRFRQASTAPFGRWGQSTHVYRAEAAVAPSPAERSLDCTGGAPGAGALAASLLPGHCADPESEERLAERGWVVLRGLATRAELDAISSRTKTESLCQPALTGTEAGQRACAFSAADFRRRLPALTNAIGGVLAGWESSGIAARARLGRRLELPRRSPRLSRLVQITTEDTFGDLQRAGASGARYFADWHVDNQGSTGMNNAHWILLVVRKKGGDAAREHGNLCVAPTAAVDSCDSPRARQLGAEDPSFWRSVWEAAACCPSLEPGDAVFYREDVAHRTQDQAVDRLSMVIQVMPEEPMVRTNEDVRCAGWAADGACDTTPEFMWCTCADSCSAVEERNEREDWDEERSDL